MKTNLPVTGQERLFPAGHILVSRTDTKGIITFANDRFVEVSGYSRQELIGKSHNIVRHPDVPPAVFQAMWDTLKSGLPWRGLVKNRCKDGGHYWVDAKVVPVKKNGEIIGYMSVRHAPASRDAIAAAEAAYRQAAAHPAAARARAGAGWRKHSSIKNGVTLGIVFVTLLMIAGGILGIGGLQRSNAAMASLYYEGTAPVQALERINFLMADNRAQIALALHHRPGAPGVDALDHGLDSHMAILETNRREIDTLWAGYRKGRQGAAEKDLADRYWQARTRYVREGLLAANRALEKGDYRHAEALLLNRVNPLYDDATGRAAALSAYLSDRAKGNFAQVTAANQGIAAVAVAGILLGSLALVLAGVYFFRATVLPLQKAVGALEEIAEGNLTGAVEASGHGEPGRVMAAVAVMQTHLQVMMDEIRLSSNSIREQCSHLNRTMMNLAEHSDEQHDRVYQTLDASQEACAGLGSLAAHAEALMGAVQETGLTAPATVDGSAPPARGDGSLPALAHEVADLARIQSFAIEDFAEQLRQIAAIIVANREEVQGAWAASQQLEKTALELDRLVKYFEA